MFKKILLTLSLVTLFAVPSYSQPKDGSASRITLKTTPAFLATFKPVVEKVRQSTVRVLVDGKDVALGTIVTGDGSIITKASEIKAGTLKVKTSDGKEYEAKLVAKDEIYDLGLLKINAGNLTPVQWATSKAAPVGDWIAAAGTGAEPVAVGVVSVGIRFMKGPFIIPVPMSQSGMMGIMLETEQAMVTQVTPGSAAAKAGLKEKDVIRLVDGQEIEDRDYLIALLKGYRAGETLKVVYEREGKRMEVQVILEKRFPDLAAGKTPSKNGKGGFRRPDQNSLGSTLSERNTGFPVFLQHDAVVNAKDCGGPLVDLDGHVIGLNIARAGRVETHAVPAEAVSQVLHDLLAVKPATTPAERIAEANASLKRAEAMLEHAKKVEDKEKKENETAVAKRRLELAKKALEVAIADEKKKTENPTESGPAPREVKK